HLSLPLRQSYQSLTPQIAPLRPQRVSKTVITTNDFRFTTVNTGHQHHIATGDKNLRAETEHHCTAHRILACQRQGVVDTAVIHSFEIGFSNLLIFWRKHQRMLRMTTTVVTAAVAVAVATEMMGDFT